MQKKHRWHEVVQKAADASIQKLERLEKARYLLFLLKAGGLSGIDMILATLQAGWIQAFVLSDNCLVHLAHVLQCCHILLRCWLTRVNKKLVSSDRLCVTVLLHGNVLG